MAQKTEFKPKAGYVYECLKPVRAKGLFRGKMVKAVKIGNVKDFTNRLGSLNTAVYENFDFPLASKRMTSSDWKASSILPCRTTESLRAMGISPNFLLAL
ncbi:MAG: hypothetical protein ACI4X9_03980 [Kiritimatiellia bacterium]